MSEDWRINLWTQGKYGYGKRRKSQDKNQRSFRSKGSPEMRLPKRNSEGNQSANNSYTFHQLEKPEEPEEIKERADLVLGVTDNGKSRILYDPKFLYEDEADDYFDRLYGSIPFETRNIVIHGVEYPMPRLVAWFGPFPYSYSGVTLEAAEMPEEVLEIKEKVEAYLKSRDIDTTFNSVLINLYRNGKDNVSWHSDDEITLGICPTIASVSLGEIRKFEIRPKTRYHDSACKYLINLVHGSLVVMTGAMQDDWQHRVPKEYQDRDCRINLTFRTVYALEETVASIAPDSRKTFSFSTCMATGDVKVVKKTCVEETEIKWELKDFSLCCKNDNTSPYFCFANTSFCLRFCPKFKIGTEYMELSLCSKGVPEYSVEYSIGLERGNGSVFQLIKGSLQECEISSNHTRQRHLTVGELMRRKSELMPLDILTVSCRLECKTDQLNSKPKLENLIQLDTLSEDFRNLLLSNESCDAKLFVMGKEYRAHRAVLMARSPVFRAMFLHDTSEKRTGNVFITDCDSKSFGEFLHFLYSGKLKEPSFCNVLSLYKTSEKYSVQELKTFCTDFLSEKLTTEHFRDVVIMADKYDDIKLFMATQCFFNKNLKSVLVTPGWDNLLSNNRRLAKKLLVEMSSKVKVVE